MRRVPPDGSTLGEGRRWRKEFRVIAEYPKRALWLLCILNAFACRISFVAGL